MLKSQNSTSGLQGTSEVIWYRANKVPMEAEIELFFVTNSCVEVQDIHYYKGINHEMVEKCCAICR